jgi:hypothetical protein
MICQILGGKVCNGFSVIMIEENSIRQEKRDMEEVNRA